ncbi:MAG: hypothetical protein EA342_02755 [Leptolyngbya sp. LCM1.Bin17]|nr:MAG: hypothetical protein EA342_02755 [Leptolyngbya sp. LCM1.Bin17]
MAKTFLMSSRASIEERGAGCWSPLVPPKERRDQRFASLLSFILNKLISPQIGIVLNSNSLTFIAEGWFKLDCKQLNCLLLMIFGACAKF